MLAQRGSSDCRGFLCIYVGSFPYTIFGAGWMDGRTDGWMNDGHIHNNLIQCMETDMEAERVWACRYVGQRMLNDADVVKEDMQWVRHK